TPAAPRRPGARPHWPRILRADDRAGAAQVARARPAVLPPRARAGRGAALRRRDVRRGGRHVPQRLYLPPDYPRRDRPRAAPRWRRGDRARRRTRPARPGTPSPRRRLSPPLRRASRPPAIATRLAAGPPLGERAYGPRSRHPP